MGGGVSLVARAALSGLVVAAAASLPAATAERKAAGTPAPALPRAHVDTTLVPSSGPTVLVRAGADLQAALDAAQPGDTIALEAGATFTGPFTLPAKPGTEWITIRSTAPDDRLPPPGIRADPSRAAVMPKLEAGSDSVVTTAPGAHHYRLVGIEIRPRAGTFLYNVITLGMAETAVSDLPHHLIFDRCYIHGDAKRGARRGVALNSWYTAVIDSYLSTFKEAGADSQAIAGWNGMGPFKIENNYLEGAGENVMFGGAVPSIRDLVPSDIEVRRNHFSKPTSWKVGDPAYEGTAWTVKNLFELKNARRVLVDGNTFERNWVQAQNGFAILFTVRTEGGAAPWAAVEDVTFSNNTIRQVASGVNILGSDPPTGQTRRVAIRNNLFDDVGGEAWGGGGTFLQVLEGAADVVVEHNTVLQTGRILLADGQPNPGFVYRNNIAPHNEYGMVGSGTAPGSQTLATYFPGSSVAHNVIVGGRPELYPAENFFPASLDQVGFVDRARGDYRLAAASPYRSAGTDGQDVGVLFSQLTEAAAAPVAQTAGRARPGGPPPAPGRRPAAPPERKALPGWRSAARIVLWSCGALLAYTYVGYPLAIALWPARRRPRPQGDHHPAVSLLIVARNEASRIGARIENLLSLDYPADRVELLVASDGSTDRTADQARSREDPRLRVFAFDRARGKPAVLNELVPQARGAIVVLADARQRFEAGALRALVAPFIDPAVGAVSGELVLAPNAEGTAVGDGVGLYWRYEKSIRRNESRLDSTVGATGAIYAIRRDAFRSIPEDTVLDDVLVPMMLVAQGYRALFEPAARACDRAAATATEEFRRKVRTIAGNFQLFARNPWLLDPRRNRLWLQTLSHKGLRLLTPLLLAAALAANVALAGTPAYRWALAAHLTFYAGAASGFALRNLPRKAPFLTIPCLICLLSWATVVAFVRFVTGRQPVTWEKAAA